MKLLEEMASFLIKVSALADPTRRRILEMLAGSDELNASEIHAKFQVSPQAVSQHLKILREAKLVHVEKRAQQRIYQMNPAAMIEVEEWASHYRQLWSGRFEALDKVLEAQKKISLEKDMEGKDEPHDKK